ncbi:Uncharacterized protein dnm_093530 [Desulfonema magnum]|uniref:Uncharacterized protein n=1 Tax=Desulfonema magnum TaxID=45655 RepID=A0A975GTR1_9BACT|nr:Uncharacterized protein dnm_093530 [Desulfonema magnum]
MGRNPAFRAGETVRPGKKPGFFGVPSTARKFFDLLNMAKWAYIKLIKFLLYNIYRN